MRRVYIPKPGKTEKRPLGIPTLHDRACQCLVKLALEPEGEAKFHPESYGFRPGRSAQDAIEAIRLSIEDKGRKTEDMERKNHWIFESDREKCFDRINHDYLLEKLQTFPHMRRIIKGWLTAGCMEGERMEIDHIIPRSLGGPDWYSNLQLLHQHCHDAKTAKDVACYATISSGAV
jgi:RNA-directed DNA polymerase